MKKNISNLLNRFKVEKRHVRDSGRQHRVTEQKKFNKPFLGAGIPSNFEGSDGDSTIREIKSKGIYSFTKFKGSWFSSKLDLKEAGAEIFNTNTAEDDILVYE